MGGEEEGAGGGVGAALFHCFNRVSWVFLLSSCQSEMKAEMMRS